MVRKIKNTLLAITVLTVLGMEAQVAPAWNKLFNKAVVWQKVFSSGNYLVSTHDNFFLIDQETGDAVWSNSKFTDIPQSSVSELKGSFLFEINKEDVTYLLDPFSGKSKFDSKSSGISKLEHKQVLGLSGNLFVAGVSDGENQKIINVDLESGKIIWELREKFGKIISLNELNANEFLMVSLFNSYRINSKTGEVIWKKKNSDDNDKLDKLGKFGSLLKDVATAAAKDMDFNTKFYLNKEKNIFILGTQEETVTTSPNGD
ncbi:MAG: outer membrane protein assembly factor BamB, partial [Flavobacteriales bacterium]